MEDFDELSIYRGRDIQINPKIIVSQPTLDQIEKFGEKRYFSTMHTLTAVGADLKWQLWDFYGIDYTQIEDYDLFLQYISHAVSSKKKIYNELINNKEKYENELLSMSKDDLDELLINPLELVLKYSDSCESIDLADFILCTDTRNGQIVLYNMDKDVTIDRYVYQKIAEAIRKIHGYKRNDELPGNEATKRDLIDDARDDAMISSGKPYKSVLRPLVSAMTVKCGLCGDDKIWNMKISQFFDNIKRISKIQDAQLLLQGAYSGFASLKGVDKSRLDWAGDI